MNRSLLSYWVKLACILFLWYSFSSSILSSLSLSSGAIFSRYSSRRFFSSSFFRACRSCSVRSPRNSFGSCSSGRYFLPVTSRILPRYSDLACVSPSASSPSDEWGSFKIASCLVALVSLGCGRFAIAFVEEVLDICSKSCPPEAYPSASIFSSVVMSIFHRSIPSFTVACMTLFRSSTSVLLLSDFCCRSTYKKYTRSTICSRPKRPTITRTSATSFVDALLGQGSFTATSISPATKGTNKNG
mmetsp:Transcript_16990/g.42078  ORF Transcript_16990/g.42078 Transcript_16990/m.42078 type:complete len:244 (+) Transcript_16990:1873-2604(+)